MTSTLADRVHQVLEKLPQGAHLCHFYRTPRDMLDVLVPYFALGFARNEKGLWIVDDAIDLEAARDALSAAVPDLEEHIRAGRFEFGRHTEWYLLDGSFDEARVLQRFHDKETEALAHGFQGLRVSGNALWAAEGPWTDFIEYERAVDRCFCHHRMSAMCTYPLDRCTAADIVDLTSAHELVLVRRDGAWDIIESAALRQAREDLRESHARLRTLARQTVVAEQRERQRVSRELHDGLQQTIVGAQLQLSRARRGRGPGRQDALARAEQLMAEALHECRTLTTEISPPVLYERGLVAGVRWLARWFGQQYDLAVHVEAPDADPPLGESERLILFEVARELLFNVVEHARVSEARVLLIVTSSQVVLEVSDDGVGCHAGEAVQAAEGRFGLLNAAERLRMMEGAFVLESAPGRGARARATLPLGAPAIDGAPREEDDPSSENRTSPRPGDPGGRVGNEVARRR